MSYSYSGQRRFGDSRPRFNLKKPVELDKVYEAEIEDISRRWGRDHKNRRIHHICVKH